MSLYNTAQKVPLRFLLRINKSLHNFLPNFRIFFAKTFCFGFRSVISASGRNGALGATTRSQVKYLAARWRLMLVGGKQVARDSLRAL